MRNSWITTEQQQHKPLVGKLETYSQTKGVKLFWVSRVSLGKFIGNRYKQYQCYLQKLIDNI